MHIGFDGPLTKDGYLHRLRLRYRSPVLRALRWTFYLGLPALIVWVTTQLVKGTPITSILGIGLIPSVVLLFLLFVVRHTRSRWNELSPEQKTLKGWITEDGIGWIPEANRIWHKQLGSINGIYLILDMATGNQYIGSAYGRHGVMGRWCEYAQSGHGGNKELIALTAGGADYAYNFQFTILQTLPKTMTSDEVIQHEILYKKKLGTRAHGLNRN